MEENMGINGLELGDNIYSDDMVHSVSVEEYLGVDLVNEWFW